MNKKIYIINHIDDLSQEERDYLLNLIKDIWEIDKEQLINSHQGTLIDLNNISEKNIDNIYNYINNKIKLLTKL
jgi:hypothetical protein